MVVRRIRPCVTDKASVIVDPSSSTAPSEPIRVVVEVDRAVDPIEGRICPPAGRPQPFVGWLQLVQVLDLSLTAIQNQTDQRPKGSPSSQVGSAGVDRAPDR